jgi:hypothetical protein
MQDLPLLAAQCAPLMPGVRRREVTMAHFVRAFLIVTAIITATFLPFFPGGYDPLSRPLSGMAWVLGRVGLLLVPVGGLWLWFSQRPEQ